MNLVKNKQKLLLFMSIKMRFLSPVVLSFCCLAYGNFDYKLLDEKYQCLFDMDRPFVTSYFQGELGNRLYQIAAGISFALGHGCRYVAPKIDYPQILWRIPYSNSLVVKNCFRTVNDGPMEKLYLAKKRSSYVITIPYMPNMQLCGYFISYKYFDHYRDLMVSLFRPSEKIKEYIFSKYGDLLNHPCSVGLHVRTFSKDVVGCSSQEIKGFYSSFLCPSLKYIQKAIDCFPKDALFVICTDNVSWTKKALKTLAGNFYVVEGEPCYIDFYILSLCKHDIISHSTFSWWAAYLNENPEKKVIAPVPYMGALKSENAYPSNFTLIEREEFGFRPCFDDDDLFVKI